LWACAGNRRYPIIKALDPAWLAVRGEKAPDILNVGVETAIKRMLLVANKNFRTVKRSQKGPNSPQEEEVTTHSE